MTRPTDGVEAALNFQGRRTSYLVSHPALSDSQASHHMLDQQPHVGAQESSAPMNGFSDADARVRQRWSCQRQAYSGDGAEENCWQRATKSVSRVGPANPRLQVCIIKVIFILFCLRHSLATMISGHSIGVGDLNEV